MAKVSLVTCYKSGTQDILSVMLSAIARHTSKTLDYEVIVVSADARQANNEINDMLTDFSFRLGKRIRFISVDIPSDSLSMSHIHGNMLDKVIPDKLDCQYVLTMDTDCFPVADGWMEKLLELMLAGNTCAGILHPWAPAPATLKQNTIEYRVRYQHCWNMTHVACQMLPLAFLQEHKVKYATGDDTGLSIPLKVRQLGHEIAGFKPTRCPMPSQGLDAEFNRYMGIVFGDMMYHHGGFTRTSVGGDEDVFAKNYGWLKQRIVQERGAEFLLNEGYVFKFDKEEEVAKEKMQRLFGLNSQTLKG